MSSQAGILGVALGQFAVRRDDTKFLLAGEGFFAQLVPALVEFAFVFVGPFLGHVVRSMSSARCEIDEEGLVRGKGLLLGDPFRAFIRHVVDKVVALFWSLLVLNRRRALEERRIPLVCLAADEAVEIFEATTTGRPGVEGPVRTRLPYGHFMALAELRGGVAVEFEGSR